MILVAALGGAALGVGTVWTRRRRMWPAFAILCALIAIVAIVAFVYRWTPTGRMSFITFGVLYSIAAILAGPGPHARPGAAMLPGPRAATSRWTW